MKLVSCATMLAAAMLVTPLALDANPEAKRKFIDENGKAVITVEVVMNIKMAGGGQQRESEQKTEVIAFLLDDKGI